MLSWRSNYYNLEVRMVFGAIFIEKCSLVSTLSVRLSVHRPSVHSFVRSSVQCYRFFSISVTERCALPIKNVTPQITTWVTVEICFKFNRVLTLKRQNFLLRMLLSHWLLSLLFSSYDILLKALTIDPSLSVLRYPIESIYYWAFPFIL